MTTSSRNKYAPKAWGKEVLVDLPCPSGQLCQVRRPGIPGLIKAGILDSLDSLTGLVQTEHIDRVRKGEIKAEDMQDLAKNKDKLLQAMTLADKVVCYAVVQPKVLPDPEEGAEREPGAIYVEDIDLTDKMFIFQFVVGGVSDLEQFRKEFGETLGSLENVADVPGPA